ncbi:MULTISPECIES: peptide deformylase [unclassified Crossiella]|uniref:peptide deformylase n=1 Tax=unclassified Crossiella TaxID=2620835 RepID=UPI001FFF8905|nr:MULTISPECIES: peptide deformylase [unclassified Crossiella]MCK2243799.1 peptide deformylase [Crossiella sp. S99.2]MCK2257658.1 peptide deformylase [Crossiella sp. S99.1]
MSSTGTARPIVYYGDPVLHRSCTPVTSFDDELKTLVEDMFAAMYAAEGVGLAANQIGVDARVFVMDCPDADGNPVIATLINPVLTLPPAPRELTLFNEGCLSVPGQFAELSRSEHAEATGFDVEGNPVTVRTNGIAARCLQHEVDHLDGLAYVDRLPVKQRKEILAAAGLSG